MIVRKIVSRNASHTFLVSLLIAIAGLFPAVGASRSKTPAPTATANKENSAKPKQLAVRIVRVLPSNGVISAFEPVIIEAEVTNESSESFEIYSSTDEDVRIEVRNSKGVLVGDTPVYAYGESASFPHILNTGQSAQSFLIPSAVYQFKTPGTYSVRVIFLNIPSASSNITNTHSDLGSWAEVTVPLTVQPFDEKRLRTRCKELINHRETSGFPPRECMMALWSVHHNAALPALKFVTDTWNGTSYGWPARVAISRIGTPEATELLKSVQSQDEKLGTAVNSGKPLVSNIHDWDYFSGWNDVKSTVSVNDCLYQGTMLTNITWAGLKQCSKGVMFDDY